VLTPKLDFLAGVNADLKTSFSTSFSETVVTTSGVQYRDGAWSPVKERTETYSFSPPTLKGEFSASVYAIIPRLSVLVEGVLCPYLDLRPSFDASGSVSTTGSMTTLSWTLSLGLAGSAGIKLDILDIVKVDKSFELFAYKKVIATGTVKNPEAPRGLSAAVSGQSIRITWQPPSSDGGSRVLAYEVYRGASSGGESFLAEMGNVTSFLDANVTAGAKYYYRVSAKNILGEGNLSNEAGENLTSIVGKWILVTWLQEGNLTYMPDTWLQFNADGTMLSYQQGASGTGTWRDLGNGNIEWVSAQATTALQYSINGNTLVLQGYTTDTHVWVVLTLTRA